MVKVFNKIFDTNKMTINKYKKIVEKVNSYEEEVSSLSDLELKGKTEEFKARLVKEKVTDILPEAYSVVREASKRVLGMRHYDTQILGGIVLNHGDIAEMRTGEGKTLVATLPLYLNALTGDGAHLITVNDYLAERDSMEMGKVFEFLGMSVGLNISGLNSEQKKSAYEADITYGTNSEFGFDYLRDNMAVYQHDKVQKGLDFVIVDEVDSVLIDEARTPLIISGNSKDSTETYLKANKYVKTLKRDEDYIVDIKSRSVQMTENGSDKAEAFFGVENIYDYSNVSLVHHINQALVASAIMKREVDYVIKEGKVVIIDQFTGRLMEGRRYSDGLHQAIEAKEGLAIQQESKTLASITFQNYFRMYNKISGMTGTARTEEEEFRKIYNMNVVEVPTNRPVIRNDYPDFIYKDEKEKFEAVVQEVKKLNHVGQPVLIGTINVETSESLSKLFKQKGIKHNVLNAKNHGREADIIEDAGQMNSVTIATNMAGRGTDIKINQEVKDLGGLAIIGTERHESRRIDNQLRGRSGRQGDPGESRFFVSLEDNLVRRFGSDRLKSVMERMPLEKGEPIESKIITKAIETAQKRVEGNNFDARKKILEYDDVMREQREIIYKQRDDVLSSQNLRQVIEKMTQSTIERLLDTHAPEKMVYEDWDLVAICEFIKNNYLNETEITPQELRGKDRSEIKEIILHEISAAYDAKEEKFPNEVIRELEKSIIIKSVDRKWMDHIDAMSQLRDGIHLRAYGQNDPLKEYAFEGYQMFSDMISSIEGEVSSNFMRARLTSEPKREKAVQGTAKVDNGNTTPTNKPIVKGDKVGRNEACPCGSGKKYKKCCSLTT